MMKSIFFTTALFLSLNSVASQDSVKYCKMEIYVKYQGLAGTTYTPSGEVESKEQCVRMLKSFMNFLGAKSGSYWFFNGLDGEVESGSF